MQELAVDKATHDIIRVPHFGQMVRNVALYRCVEARCLSKCTLNLGERVILVRGGIDAFSCEEVVRWQGFISRDDAIDVGDNILVWLLATEALRVKS